MYSLFFRWNFRQKIDFPVINFVSLFMIHVWMLCLSVCLFAKCTHTDSFRRKSRPITLAVNTWKYKYMDSRVYCMTHCVLLQLPWWDWFLLFELFFFFLFILLYFTLINFGGGCKSREQTWRFGKMNGMKTHDAKDTKYKFKELIETIRRK